MSVFRPILKALGFAQPSGLGFKADRVDPRDFPVDELLMRVGAAVVPVEGNADSPELVVKDQTYTNSCAGQSIANAVRASYLALGQDCPDLSALFSYYGSRAENSKVISDDGAYLRDGIKVLQKLGECPESAWPFVEGRVNRPPSWSAYRAAVPRRGVRGYYKIPDGDVDRIKRTLAAKIPVVAGWSIDAAFAENTSPGTIQGRCRGKSIGGHAMVILSFYKNKFRCLNSWGKGFRDGGRFDADEEFIAQAISPWAIDVRTA